MVDAGDTFEVAIDEFIDWIQAFDDDYVICSWGYYDKKQFTADCRRFNIQTDWLDNHISIKHQYAEINKLRRPVGMKTALSMENIPLEGTHHRGIDDARNIAKIFARHLSEWEIRMD
jgi:3'-5' exoribonuclease 1